MQTCIPQNRSRQPKDFSSIDEILNILMASGKTEDEARDLLSAAFYDIDSAAKTVYRTVLWPEHAL